MNYQGKKYLPKTSLLKMLKNKFYFDLFKDQESISFSHRNTDYLFYHIQDIYDMLISHKIDINDDNSILSQAITQHQAITFNFLSTARYAKNYHLPAVINVHEFKQTLVMNQNFQKYYDSLQCLFIRGNKFFDTDNIIELLINETLELSPNGNGLASQFKSAILYHEFNHKIIEQQISIAKHKV